MTSQNYSGLRLTVADHVAELQLCREASGNAFDESLHGEFAGALTQLRNEIDGGADIRAVLIHAAGRMFSVGGDFDYIRRLGEDAALREKTSSEGEAIFAALTELPAPVVVALQGHAVGFGATVASLCDVVVAWKGAKLGDPHVQVGLVAGDGGVLGWTAAVGMQRARRLLLTGDTITAEEAHRYGLVTDLVDLPESTLPEARRIAQRIAALPPIAVQGTRRIFNALGRRHNGRLLDLSIAAELESAQSEDLREALAALREKRAGHYHNR